MKNFLAMPGILKMLTAVGFCTLIWVAASLNGVSNFGEHVNASTWWGSGAGYCMLIAAIVMSGASVLMIRRSKYGRPVYIVGWLILGAVAFIGALVAKIPYDAYWPSLAGHFAMTACVALYLYLSKAVKLYFVGSAQ
jgi:hypothetical protein